MARRKRIIQVAMVGVLAALFAFPAQLVIGQDQPEVKRKVKSQVNPTYPELARRMNVRGKVRLEVTVEPNGSVKSVHVLGGHPLLVGAAEEAVKQWKFEAGPKETTNLVIFNFD